MVDDDDGDGFPSPEPRTDSRSAGFDTDSDRFPSPEPRTDSRSALLRGFRAWRRLRIVKHDESFSLIFFLPEREYMELELRSVEVQGAHKVGWRAPGGRRAPTLGARV